ncbi:NAD-dependent protein lipoamidase sirtuin-4 [Clonorchis sinensis]|uniref:NAD-dependent protein lipoamidase sirtuin-4 n=1 Tax=Clonorchis sinensis TaxID=79923 RepID=A0A8T1MRT3_CLOSI|nr:NAD-dependent protein lipoamidase sirtuin-4 [Clonorchis sinensis]
MLVLTGAGVSTESGLPDYRSERVGLYARTDRRPVEFQTFLRNEEARRFYWARNFIGWPYFSQVQPNTSHHILADWASNKRLFAIITQNVDRLHHRAGCNRILELHGTSHYVVCLTCQHRFGRAELQQMFLELNPSWAVYDGKEKVVAPDGDVELSPSQTQGFKIPTCPQCGDGILKPDVVFFGENLPPWRKTEAAQLVDNADSLLCLGTSLQTFSSYRLVLQACERKLPVSIVNIGPTRADSLAQLRLYSRISTTLEMADRLLSKYK